MNLEVHTGDIYGFLGPNGSGKSTTIRILLSLVKPDFGQMSIFDLDIRKSRKQILSKIGALVERPNFYEHLSASKNLSLLLKYSGKENKQQDIADTLKMVGLAGREHDKVGNYSEGMKQRLGIAQAIIHQPELLIFDEPFSNLDPQGIRDIRDIVVKLNQDKGVTILISSHNLDEIEKLVNRVGLISNGRTVAEGNIQDLIKHDKAKVSLEVDDLDKAILILKKSGIQMGNIEVDENRILIHCNRDLIPGINTCLVENNINVFSLSPDKSLESFFLSFT